MQGMSVHRWAKEGFSRGATAYERVRPAYPGTAVAYLIQACGLKTGTTVLDLAAGTGKLTQLLVASGAHVVAVEPVAAMRQLIPTEAIDVLDGSAEAIPLQTASTDAVVVAQAFHWFDTDAALAEIHRVLCPDGCLSIVRNQRDLDDPVQRAFEETLGRHRWHPSLEAQLDVESVLRTARLFELREHRTFTNEHELAADDLVALAASETSISLLGGSARTAAVADFEQLAKRVHSPLRLRYTTEVYIADRR
jgi:SAM-dependent methyltransferase